MQQHDADTVEAAKRAVIALHVDGWNAKSIGAYLGTSRQTVHTILRRWVEEGWLVLDEKTRGPKPGFRAVDFPTMAQIKKLQENPRLGAFRMHGALKQLGLHVSVRTCGRIMAHHRSLYGLGQPPKERTEKKPMPFAASERHEYWTVDIRYLDTPLLGQQAYCVTILDNFSRAIVASIVSPTQDLAAYLNPQTTLLYIHLSGHELAECFARGMSHVHAWRIQTLEQAIADDAGNAGG